LVLGKSLRIEGGEYFVGETRCFFCRKCEHHWDVAYGVARPQSCPVCASEKVFRCDAGRGRGGRARGCCRCSRL
jgi:predicted Zn-ribbon and HTH transcriptional regulator